jgi:hypothetical protein
MMYLHAMTLQLVTPWTASPCHVNKDLCHLTETAVSDILSGDTKG